MKTLRYSIIILSCFCTFSFILIPLNLLSFCIHPNEFGTSHVEQCESVMSDLKSILSIFSGVGITAIICMIYFISRKTSVIIYIVVASMLIPFFAVGYLLTGDISSVPPGEMRPVSFTYQWGVDFVQSPLWNSVFVAIFTSTIVWPIIIFRNKIRRVVR